MNYNSWISSWALQTLWQRGRSLDKEVSLTKRSKKRHGYTRHRYLMTQKGQMAFLKSAQLFVFGKCKRILKFFISVANMRVAKSVRRKFMGVNSWRGRKFYIAWTFILCWAVVVPSKEWFKATKAVRLLIPLSQSLWGVPDSMGDPVTFVRVTGIRPLRWRADGFMVFENQIYGSGHLLVCRNF